MSRLATTEPVMMFRVGPDWYGAGIAQVREVVATPTVTAVPFAPAYLRGMVMVRGEIVSVLDIRQIVPQAAEASQSTESALPARLVVVSADGMDAGLLADEVAGVVSVERPAAAAVVSWQGRAVRLLAVPALLDQTRIRTRMSGEQRA